jgi:hypothetical protein
MGMPSMRDSELIDHRETFRLKTMKTIPLTVLLLISSVATVQATLVSNGSFEDPTHTSEGFFFNGDSIGSPGWTVEIGIPTVAVTISDSHDDSGTIWPKATDGTLILYLGDSALTATIYQDITLAAFTSHELTFDLGSLLSGGIMGAMVDVDVTLAGSSILPGGVAATFSRPDDTGFASQMLSFNSTTAGTYRLWFTSYDGHGANLDNVVLTAGAAVPEASAFMCVGVVAGLIGLGAAWKRTKARNRPTV